MEEKIKKIKNIVIAVLIAAAIIGLVISRLKPAGTKPEDIITFYDTGKTEVSDQKKTEDSSVEGLQNQGIESLTDAAISDNAKEQNPSNSGKISLNKATLDELMSLPGIGETKAKAILDYRAKYGKFVSIEELTQVKGIGDATLNKLRDYICL